MCGLSYFGGMSKSAEHLPNHESVISAFVTHAREPRVRVIGFVAIACALLSVGCATNGAMTMTADDAGIVQDDASTTSDAATTHDAGVIHHDASPLDFGMAADMSADMATDDLGIDTDMGVVITDPTPTRYPSDTDVSPFTPSVVAKFQSLLVANSTLWNDAFMKIGGNETANAFYLTCFSGPNENVNLDSHTELTETIASFAAGDAAGVPPFNRHSVAAPVNGNLSTDSVGGPTPIDTEYTAILPRFAFVNSEISDMATNTTAQGSLRSFYTDLNAVLDDLDSKSVMPIVSGTPPRADDATFSVWSRTYDAVARGVSEHRQVPFISLVNAMSALPGNGLTSDGITGTAYETDIACDFSPDGLQNHYNVRNLRSMEVLHALDNVGARGGGATDEPIYPILGTGTHDDPFIIDSLPFTHFADTSMSTSSVIDHYAVCSTGQNESGPEFFYQLHLDVDTHVRLAVLCLGTTDVDVHLLNAADDSCIARGDTFVQRTTYGGDYLISVDSYVSSSGTVNSGEYLLVALPCDDGDTTCM